MRLLPLRFVPLPVALALVTLAAFAAANAVPASRLGNYRTPTSANALKPLECAALNLVEIHLGSTGGRRQFADHRDSG